jgi:hypothetical protein
MKRREVTFGEIGLIAVTRAMLGAGAGLLLSEKFTAEQRRAVGWTLVLVGAVTTVPLLMTVASRGEESRNSPTPRRAAEALRG